MQSEIIVLIDGHPACGKSLIRGMLDGHPQVFASPFHDILPLAFCEPELDKKALEAKDLEWLKQKLVCLARYSRIERVSYQKKFYFEPVAGEFFEVDLGFDFPSFERSWIEKVLMPECSDWSPAKIISHIYTELGQSLAATAALNYDEDNIHVLATLGDGNTESPKRFLDRFPAGKLIYMRRDPVEIIAALCARKPQPGNYRTADDRQDLLFKRYMRNGFVSSIKKKERIVSGLLKEYPDRVMVVNFEDFFRDIVLVKSRISEFLCIEVDDSLGEFTLNRQPVAFDNGVSMFSRPIDNPENLLTNEQRKVANAMTQDRFYFSQLTPTFFKHKTAVFIERIRRLTHKIYKKFI